MIFSSHKVFALSLTQNLLYADWIFQGLHRLVGLQQVFAPPDHQNALDNRASDPFGVKKAVKVGKALILPHKSA